MRKLLLYTCIIACATLLVTLQSCKKCNDPRDPDCENYDPCMDAKQTSAAFTIKEATYTQIIEPRLADFLMDTDSVYFSSVYFEATQADADSFIWQIGSEIEPRYGKQVNVKFPDNMRGSTFTIRLIVKRTPNTRCFPNDDGIDTVIRQFYFVRFNEPLSWEGTYYGSDDNKPDSLYTIVLGHSFDEVEEENIVKVFGVPRGCRDTMNISNNGFVGFKNMNIFRDGLGCEQKILRGVFKNGNAYRIKIVLIEVVNGAIIEKERIFTGAKLN